MALKRECEKYLMQAVYVMPITGSGWMRLDHAQPIRNRWHGMGPAPFHLFVKNLVTLSDRLIGFEGSISEKDHFYDTYHCSVIDRYGDALCDLYEKKSSFNIAISKSKIHVDASADRPMFEWFNFDLTSRSLFGYGIIFPTKED